MSFFIFKRLALTTVLFGALPLWVHAKVYKIDGSSTVYPITEAMVEEYQNAKKNNTKIIIGVSGTGGGFKKFCRGEIDIAEASRPIKESEIKDCEKKGITYITVPIAFDAAVIAVHPTNILKQITLEQLKKIWEPQAQNKIKKWNEIDPTWPDKKLTLFGAGTDSGTFEYFTEVIVGKSRSSRGDYTASEDDNILVEGISKDPAALGYVPYAYYMENQKKLKALAVQNKAGSFILPTFETVKDKSYNPLSRPLFIYINKASLNDATFKDFVKFYIESAKTYVTEVKYVPLEKEQYEADLKLIEESN